MLQEYQQSTQNKTFAIKKRFSKTPQSIDLLSSTLILTKMKIVVVRVKLNELRFLKLVKKKFMQF